MEHDRRAGRASGRKRPPTERRVEIVGVHDARPSPSHGLRDVLRREPAVQQPGGRTPAVQLRRLSLEQLRLLAQSLAHEPQQILDGPLLAAGDAVTVVQEKDHERVEAQA
ncbi:MAG: hypothetical protein ACRDMX_14035 [Solirubrobacteraceae bacterium]